MSDRPSHPERPAATRDLPDAIEIAPRGPIDASLRVPGSKSITNRALLCAALAGGESTLAGGLASDDTHYMRRALMALGVELNAAPGSDPWRVAGCNGRLGRSDFPLFLGNAGTATRFMTAAATLAAGPTVVDGSERMRERPIADLVDALRELGAAIPGIGPGGCPPVELAGGGLPGGRAEIDASRSSQYVSAVLLVSPYARADVSLGFASDEIVSRSYIELTLQVMQAFGADASWDDAGELRLAVRAGCGYTGREYAIEPDASSAAYPLCATAIAGGRITLPGLGRETAQPDYALIDLLERMGCRVERGDAHTTLEAPPDRLRALGKVDMNHCPDAVLAYAVTALFADGPTRIENVANLRIKETDRLAALEMELRKLGARATAGPDFLEVAPGPLRSAEIDTYDDHRMAMAFALAGLRVPGVVIKDPGCISKSWPGYFDALAAL